MGTVVAPEYLTIDGVVQDSGGVGEIEASGWNSQFWDDDLANLQSSCRSPAMRWCLTG